MSKLDQVNFSTMPEQWTPVAQVKELRPAKPLSLSVDDVPVVFFRDAAGHLRALVDQCPHRKVQFSNGKVTEEGYLQCPFHGWQFDGTGTCQRIPLNNLDEEQVNNIKANCVPCYEGKAFLWLYTAVTTEDVGLPPIPKPLSTPEWSGGTVVREWNAHWSRAVQTMLDVAHIPFVHRKTIGFSLGRAVGKTADARLRTELKEKENGGYEMDWTLSDLTDDASADRGKLKFLPPNGTVVEVMTKGNKQWLQYIWCVPTAEGKSKQFAIARRNFGRFNPLWKLADLLNIVILNEDKRNVESAWPSAVPRAELSMPSDASTVAFQKYHYRTFLKRESKESIFLK